MRATIAMATALLLAACAGQDTGPTLTQAQSQCGYNSRPFAEAWPCVRSTLAPYPGEYPDIRATFLAQGNVLLADMNAGKITEEQARAGLDVATAQARTAARRQDEAGAASNAFVLSQMRPYQPPPVPALTYTMPPPATLGTICQRIGNTLTCN